MFDFKLSEELVRKIVANLRTELADAGETLPEPSSNEIESLRTEWGRIVVGAIGTRAQQVRYELAESFTVLQDGRLPIGMDDSIGGRIGIPTGPVGDALLHEVCNEFLEWMRKNAPSLELSPGAPIAKFIVEDQCVTAYVRPKDPPTVVPGFEPSERVE